MEMDAAANAAETADISILTGNGVVIAASTLKHMITANGGKIKKVFFQGGCCIISATAPSLFKKVVLLWMIGR